MKFVQTFLVVLSLVGALLLAGSGMAAAATINVTTTTDGGAGSLRAALATANGGGDNTINLTVAGTYKSATGAFTYTGTGNLTITNTSGGTVVVDGNHLDQVFNLNPSANTPTVTLSGFTVTNGLTNGNGGGISCQNGNLTLTSVVLSNNSSQQNYGGGIYFTGGTTLSVQNSTVAQNSAYYYGGGIYIETGSLSVQGSTFTGNTSVDDYGGGICVIGQDVSLTVANCAITQNRAMDGEGGGIFFESDATFTLTSTNVSGNYSASEGGGVYIEGWSATPTATMTNCTISNNTTGDSEGAGI
jgi:predicted outer membrane repeat protein